MEKNYITLMTFCLITIFLLNLSLVSAFEFDNVKSYNPITREVTITNAFGLGAEIGKARLNTPLNVKVPRGYQKVAEFDLWAYQDYNDALKQFSFTNLKKREKINRDYDLKYLTYEDVLVNDYKTECSELWNETNNSYSESCIKVLDGSHYEQREVWNKITPANLKKNEVLTVGVFTDVQSGDYVDWVPTIYGVEVEEWASWTEDLNVGINGYFKLDEGSGAVIDSTGNYNGTDQGATPGATGIINNAYSFTTNDYIDTTTRGTLGSNLGNGFSISFWLNTTSTSHEAVIGSFNDAGAGDGSIVIELNLNSVGADDAGKIHMHLKDIDGNNLESGTTNDITFSDGAFHHIVVTMDGDNNANTLYLDGVNQSLTYRVQTTPDNFANFDYGITLGASNFRGTRYWYYEGIYDEVGMWNRILSESEITNLYNGGNGISYIGVFNDPPNITLNSPSSANYTTLQSLEINLTAYDNINLTDVKLYINDVLNQTNASGINNTDYIFDLNLGDGDYTIYGKATDNESEETNSSSIRIVIDTINPDVTILYPTATNYTTNITTLNFSATDVNLDTCWYSTNNTVNITTNCSENITGLFSNEGSNTWTIYANDTFGHENESSVTFNVDTINPNVTIISPENKTYTTSNINFVVESDAQFCQFTTDGWAINYSMDKGEDYPIIFNNSLSSENLTFTRDENIIRYLEIDRYTNLTKAYMDLSGYSNVFLNDSAECNITGDVGSEADKSWDGNWSSSFNPLNYLGGGTCSFKAFVFQNYTIDSDITIINITSKFGGATNIPCLKIIEVYDYSSLNWVTIHSSRSNGNYTKEINSSFISSGFIQTRIRVPYGGGVRGSYYESLLFVGSSSYIFPNNPYLQINNINIWSHTGEFNSTETTQDLSSTINSALNSGACDCSGCSLDGNNCTIPFIFHSDTAGVLEYSTADIFIYTNSSMPDDSYTSKFWCNDSFGNINDTEQVIFGIDITLPIINITHPVGANDYFLLGNNETLNWTVIDANLDSCWFNYNNTNTTLTCGDNTTSFLYVQNVNNLTFYANDTFGNLNNQSIEWIYKVLEINQTYNNETTEGSLETFSTLIRLGSGYSITGAVLINYDGSSSSGQSFASGDNTILRKEDFLIPNVDADTNITFYWDITLSDSTVLNLTSKNQTIYNLGIDNCSSFTIELYNFTVVDEEEQTILPNATIEIAVNIYDETRTVLVLNYSTIHEKINPLRICLNRNLSNSSTYSIDVIVRYEDIGFANEYYNIIDSTLTVNSSSQIITLYDLNSTDSTEFQLSFIGSNFLPVENALVYIDRQYISENTFKTVELPKTDYNGQAVLHLVRNDVIYNIRIIKDGIILGNFENLVAFCDDFTIGDCNIELNAFDSVEGVFNYDDELGIIFTNPTYNATTDKVSFNFVTSDGSSKTVLLEVTRNDIFGNRSICNASLISSGGTLTCDVDPNIDESTLNVDVYVDGILEVKSNVQIETTNYGVGGYLIMFVMALSFIFMFSGSKTGVLVSIGLTLASSIGMGLISGTLIGIGASGIWLLVILFIGIYKLNSERQE